ncbi:MAG: beta-phosphoglucomutase family hydrolase, partial [Bacteroidales bacterium]|nr:beta-phosphoglucomutase family hydrolase [Bacteroidales bacterium]
MIKYHFKAVIFDLDGVITKTAKVHSQAWKAMFDQYLKEREKKHKEPFREFTHTGDYLPFVDGKPRYKGVESFLKARGITIPFGVPADKPEKETICALGNRKDIYFNKIIAKDGVEIFPSSVKLIKQLIKAGIKVAVATSSKNCVTVLKSVNLLDFFETRVDGLVSAELNLKGKPEPDIFRKASDNLGIQYDQAVIVEDAVSGVQAGHKGGFGFVIGVARENNKNELLSNGADIVVSDLSEINLKKIEDWFVKELPLDNWHLKYYNFDKAKEKTREALMTTANGYIGVRGAAEESQPDNNHYPGTYIAGVYNKLQSVVADKTVTNEDFVNCQDFRAFNIKINDKEISNYEKLKNSFLIRYFNIKSGILEKHLFYKFSNNALIALSSERFASMANPHLYLIDFNILTDDLPANIEISTGINADINNRGVERYKDLNSSHLTTSELGFHNDIAYLTTKTNQSNIKISTAYKIFLLPKNKKTSFLIKQISNKKIVNTIINSNLKTNDFFSLKKIISIYTSNDTDVNNTLQSAINTLEKTDYTKELINHLKIWSKIWDNIDIKLSGDRLAQKILRLHLYHLVAAASLHNKNIDAGITARGLSGEAYRGHIFWDELFIMPFYNLYFPDTAKALLMYRYRRLSQAKAYAAQFGYAGAMYPWQSGSSGVEETQTIHLNPNSGKWDPDYSSLQRHVSLAIAYNIWNYYNTTNDINFIKDYGAEMFFEICRFWASKSIFNKKTKRFEIHNVMGPDEFHEKYPGAKEGGLKDNSYTNIMVMWLFKKSEIIFSKIGKTNSYIDKKEINNWLNIAKNLNIVLSDEGILAQYDGYFNLQELDWDYYKQKYGNIHRLDRILKAEGKSPDKYKVAKQADTLQIFYNLNEKEVINLLKDAGYKVKDSLLKDNFDYYVKRTSHGSTLSRIVHSYLANKIGYKQLAIDMFTEALLSDYNDIQGGTT